jgi:hypothetical protein
MLLQLSDSSYRPQSRERFIPTVKNSLNYSHIFHGMGMKKTPENSTTPIQVVLFYILSSCLRSFSIVSWYTTTHCFSCLNGGFTVQVLW